VLLLQRGSKETHPYKQLEADHYAPPPGDLDKIAHITPLVEGEHFAEDEEQDGADTNKNKPGTHPLFGRAVIARSARVKREALAK
jgi:hypothetical protein